MTDKLKKYETIAACGIDCGLCPRFYTKGSSACPGCGGLNFKEKHPSCGVLTCCVIKSGFETCADCKDFPCPRFKTEGAGCDSFVTHKKMFSNLENIKANGIKHFIEKQKIRIDILINLFANYDDGRAKSFFCQTCALLPIDKLQEIHNETQKAVTNVELKEMTKLMRKLITETANSLGIELKMNKKSYNKIKRQMVSLLKHEDYNAWIEIAKTVEPLFGPMVDSQEFQSGIRYCIENGSSYGIEHTDGKLAGIIAIDRVKNEILWLAVNETYRGNKYGDKLVKKAIEELEKNGDIFVQTFAKSVPEGKSAIILYEKNDFVELRNAGKNPANIETIIMTRKRQMHCL